MSDRARHSRRAARALRKLSETDPAIAALALWCRHRDAGGDADGSGTGDAVPASSDGTTIFYRPRFEALTLHEQMGICAHHVLHIAFRHAARARALGQRFGEAFDPEAYNAAADAVLNEALILAGHALPRPAVLASELLQELAGERLRPEEAVARYDADRLYTRLMAAADSGASGSDAREDRSRAAGEAVRCAAETAGHRGDLEVGEAEGQPGEETGDEAEWRQRIDRALEAGRRAGRGLGALGHRLADLPENRTPWETILRRLLTKAVIQAPRQSWRRPSGRWLAMEADARRAERPVPVFEPSLRRDGAIPRIAVCLDCSGSIDTARLRLFAAQVAGIARRTGAEVHLLVFDEAVRATTRLSPGRIEQEICSASFAREGGTSFVEVIPAAASRDPSAIVVLTDLDGPMGDPPGKLPVIWAVPKGPPAPPPFGTVISLAR